VRQGTSTAANRPAMREKRQEKREANDGEGERKKTNHSGKGKSAAPNEGEINKKKGGERGCQKAEWAKRERGA